jgi:thiamine-phosphate pyrophosphorylase
MKGFYFITDPFLSRNEIVCDVKSALKAGVTVIQYRNKIASSSTMYEEARLLCALCKKALFLVNDRLDIALAVDADGIHIGDKDLPLSVARKLLGKRKIIGVSVRSLKEARAAFKGGADYLGVGPIFRTTTKKDAAAPIGTGLIVAIKKEIPLPVVAIGGITPDNAVEVIQAGADCLCAISSVLTKKDVKKEINKFQELFI